MRPRTLYISAVAVIVAIGFVTLAGREPRAPVIALQIRAYGAVIMNEQFLWEAVFDVTNLTSSTLRFAEKGNKAEVNVAERWHKLSARGLVHYLPPNGSDRFRLCVPPRARTCRVVLNCEQDPLDERINFFLSTHKLPVRFQILCRGAARRLPHTYRTLVIELSLPTTTYQFGEPFSVGTG